MPSKHEPSRSPPQASARRLVTGLPDLQQAGARDLKVRPCGSCRSTPVLIRSPTARKARPNAEPTAKPGLRAIARTGVKSFGFFRLFFGVGGDNPVLAGWSPPPI